MFRRQDNRRVIPERLFDRYILNVVFVGLIHSSICTVVFAAIFLTQRSLPHVESAEVKPREIRHGTRRNGR